MSSDKPTETDGSAGSPPAARPELPLRPKAQPAQRVALVHDWLTGMRGGEWVLEELCRLFPEAHLYTLIHVRGSVSPRIEAMDIRSSWIERLPLSPRRFRAWLPLFPAAIESFDLRGYDLVVSSSHCVAKGVLPDPRAVHLSYLHTPMRYVWDLAPEYFHPQRMGRLGRAVAPLVASYLRTWDVASNARVDAFVANSRHVARRIARYYGREAAVVHPPVDTDFYTPAATEAVAREHLLVVSALVPYKAVELAIAAARILDLPLVIAGEGSERARLERELDAGGRGNTRGSIRGNIRFVGAVAPEELRRLYRGARAFVLPGEEDFGIAALEAQACGTPVVAYARGGALETVVDGVTGAFFSEPTPQGLAHAVDRLLRTPLNIAQLREQANRFSRERFRQEIGRHVALVMERRQTKP